MFCAFAEYLALEFNDHPELVTPLTIITAVQFSIMPMRDIGKIVVSDSILKKPGKKSVKL